MWLLKHVSSITTRKYWTSLYKQLIPLFSNQLVFCKDYCDVKYSGVCYKWNIFFLLYSQHHEALPSFSHSLAPLDVWTAGNRQRRLQQKVNMDLLELSAEEDTVPTIEDGPEFNENVTFSLIWYEINIPHSVPTGNHGLYIIPYQVLLSSSFVGRVQISCLGMRMIPAGQRRPEDLWLSKVELLPPER